MAQDWRLCCDRSNTAASSPTSAPAGPAGAGTASGCVCASFCCCCCALHQAARRRHPPARGRAGGGRAGAAGLLRRLGSLALAGQAALPPACSKLMAPMCGVRSRAGGGADAGQPRGAEWRANKGKARALTSLRMNVLEECAQSPELVRLAKTHRLLRMLSLATRVLKRSCDAGRHPFFE